MIKYHDVITFTSNYYIIENKNSKCETSKKKKRKKRKFPKRNLSGKTMFELIIIATPKEHLVSYIHGRNKNVTVANSII